MEFYTTILPGSKTDNLQHQMYLQTLDMYGMSLNLEFLYASSPLIKLSSKGESLTGVVII